MTNLKETPLINKKLVAKARLENKTNPITIYSHPTSRSIRRKCISLSCKKPLHDAGTECPTESSSEERWVEAYLIQKARKQNGEIDLAGFRYRFLYSQLKFRMNKTVGKVPTLDLLLFEPKNHHLIVIELKRAKTKSSKSTAENELQEYLKRLESENLKHELIEAFDLDKIDDVKGYIVWPKERISRPWELSSHDGRNIEIEFDVLEVT